MRKNLKKCEHCGRIVKKGYLKTFTGIFCDKNCKENYLIEQMSNDKRETVFFRMQQRSD